MREELFVAQKGAGSMLNGRPIRVSETTQLRQSLLCTGFGYRRLTNELDNHREFCRMNLLTRGVRRYGSAGLDFAYIACGRYDGFWEWGLNPWDIASGILLVEEAGGLVTSVEGGPVQLDVGSILCANPTFHGIIKKALDSAKEVPINSRKGMRAFLPEEVMAELVKSGLGEA
jgi:myo-inositol-1(or 4)-monophosphatase